jgi:apolipoprotein N-acyltransferase
MKFLKLASFYAVTGVLLGIGFLYPQFWILGLVGITGHLTLLQHFDTGRVWGSFLAWWIKFLFVLGFYWTIYPIHWLPFEFGDGELLLVGLYWVTVAMFLGTGGLVLGGLYASLAGVLKTVRWLQYLLLPLIWVSAEVAGSYLLSVFTYGPGSLFNGYFSFGYVGLLLAEHQYLLQFAQVGGVYGLSVLAVAGGVWLSHYRSARLRVRQVWLPITVIGLLLVSNQIDLRTITAPSDTTTVAVVSTSFPVAEAFNRETLPERTQEQERALEVAMSTNAAYILTPEDARFFNQTDDANQALNFFDFKYPDSEVVVIDSSRVSLGDKAVLQGLVYDAGSGERHTIHKKYLVPQGEFMPYFYSSLFRALGFGELVTKLEDLLSYQIGPNVSQVALSDHHPGVLFCFESSSGTGVRQLLKERPNLPFIAHPVSHTWFNTPESLWSQMETSLQVQAVWNDVAIVSATQLGPSQLFLPNGDIEAPRVIDRGDYWEVGLFSVPVR